VPTISRLRHNLTLIEAAEVSVDGDTQRRPCENFRLPSPATNGALALQ